MTDWKRNVDLDNLVRAIESDPSIQLDLLRETNNGWHELDPVQIDSTERYPYEQIKPYQLATMSIQQKVLNKARSHLGETEDSRGRSAAGIWYAKRVRDIAFETSPWCDEFVSEMMFDVGGEELLSAAGCFALTTAHAQFLHERGVTDRPERLSPGALAFQNWDRDGVGNSNLEKIDHVEFVKRDNGDGTATFVGGNVANGVRERTRSTVYLVVQAEWWKLYRPVPVAAEDWYVVPGSRV